MNISKQWVQENKTVLELVLLFLYFTINGIINATTVLMEDVRDGVYSVAQWEPFVWELSSAYSTLLLIPAIAYFTQHYRWQWKHPVLTLAKYLGAAVVFCLLHVTLMVLFRELVYGFTSLEYHFATDPRSLLFELLYEMRKDIWSFFFFVIAIELYRYSINQWFGEAKPIFELPSESEPQDIQPLPEILLVKKMGKEFLIRTREIQWAESAGNYLNLHVNNEVYPMRTTLTEFASQSSTHGFIRTHRSQIINVAWINHIEKLPSGDANIEMRDGASLKLSRRYKSDFESFISSQA